MATLNREEQARVDKLEAMKRWQRTGERYVSDGQIAAQQKLVDFAYANAEARERNQAERQAARDAERTAVQARQEAQAKAVQDEFLRTARLRYPGTDAEWERDKDEILRQWRVQQALGGGTEDEARLAHKRQMLNRF